MNGQKSELSISLLICMYACSILASIIIIKLTKLSITYFYFEHTGLTSTIWVMLFIIFIFVVRWRILRRCRGLKWYLRLQSQDRLVVCVSVILCWSLPCVIMFVLTSCPAYQLFWTKLRQYQATCMLYIVHVLFCVVHTALLTNSAIQPLLNLILQP